MPEDINEVNTRSGGINPEDLATTLKVLASLNDVDEQDPDFAERPVRGGLAASLRNARELTAPSV